MKVPIFFLVLLSFSSGALVTHLRTNYENNEIHQGLSTIVEEIQKTTVMPSTFVEVYQYMTKVHESLETFYPKVPSEKVEDDIKSNMVQLFNELLPNSIVKILKDTKAIFEQKIQNAVLIDDLFQSEKEESIFVLTLEFRRYMAAIELYDAILWKKTQLFKLIGYSIKVMKLSEDTVFQNMKESLHKKYTMSMEQMVRKTEEVAKEFDMLRQFTPTSTSEKFMAIYETKRLTERFTTVYNSFTNVLLFLSNLQNVELIITFLQDIPLTNLFIFDVENCTFPTYPSILQKWNILKPTLIIYYTLLKDLLHYVNDQMHMDVSKHYRHYRQEFRSMLEYELIEKNGMIYRKKYIAL